jgi:ABC-type nickel/cobalt efflux system permease component RcnA
MIDIDALIGGGVGSLWLLIPSAVLLGALHGMEPGHSKTMMAAFIVGIRGTPAQASLLALTATISHTAIVWLVAILALTYGKGISAEASEPYFEIASGVIILGIGVWVLARTRLDRRATERAAAHVHHSDQRGHSHDDDHDHHHHEEEDDVTRDQNAHERAHAQEIRKRFVDRNVTTWQVALFGLTGGLIPCAAAVTVLLLCLQIQQFWLGTILVLCFSVGLALTLLASGLIAAWGVSHVSQRWRGFDAFARRAPYVSSAIILCLGLYMAYQGLSALR